jgi:hypothetical protein
MNKPTENKGIKFLKDTYNSFLYPFPGCPYCNQRERILTIFRILFLIGLFLLGDKLIDYTDTFVNSECVTQYTAMARRCNMPVDTNPYIEFLTKNNTLITEEWK